MFDESVWKNGEKIAQDYLREKGYKIVYTNFSCVGVEVDIVSVLSIKAQTKILKKEHLENKNLQIKKVCEKYLKNAKKDESFSENENYNFCKFKRYLAKNDAKNCKNEIKSLLKSLKISYKSSLKNINNVLVITEVKARSSKKFGSGFDAVDNKKIQHIKKAGEYLLRQKQFFEFEIRFDVASVDAEKLDYIENAF